MQLTVELGSVVSSVRFAERQALCAGDVYDPFVLSFPRGSEPDPSTLSVRLFDGPPDAALSNELASVSGFEAVPGHRRLLRAAWTLSTPELRALFDRVQVSDSDGPLDSYPPRSAWLVVSQPGAVFASCEVPLVLRSLVPAVNTASGMTVGERAKLAALPDDAASAAGLAAVAASAAGNAASIRSILESVARIVADVEALKSGSVDYRPSGSDSDSGSDSVPVEEQDTPYTPWWERDGYEGITPLYYDKDNPRSFPINRLGELEVVVGQGYFTGTPPETAILPRLARAESRLDSDSDAIADLRARLAPVEEASPLHVTADDVMRGWTEWVCDPPRVDEGDGMDARVAAFSVRWRDDPPGWLLLYTSGRPGSAHYGVAEPDGFLAESDADGGRDAVDVAIPSKLAGAVRATRRRVLPAALASWADQGGVADRVTALEQLRADDVRRIASLESDGDAQAREAVAELGARVSALESDSDGRIDDALAQLGVLAGNLDSAVSRLEDADAAEREARTAVASRVEGLEGGSVMTAAALRLHDARIRALESDSDLGDLASRVSALEAAEAGAQADWSESDPASPSYVRNRPDVSLLLTRAEAEDGWTAWTAPSGAPEGAAVEFSPVKGSWYLARSGARISEYAGGATSSALTFTYDEGGEERSVAYSRSLIRPTRMSQLQNDAGYVTTFDAGAGALLLASSVAPAWAESESDGYSEGDVVSAGGRLWRRTASAAGGGPQSGSAGWSETDAAGALEAKGLATRAYVDATVPAEVRRLAVETGLRWEVVSCETSSGGPYVAGFVSDDPWTVTLREEGGTADEYGLRDVSAVSDSDGVVTVTGQAYPVGPTQATVTVVLEGRVRNVHGLARLEDLKDLENHGEFGADRTSQLENDGSDGEHPYVSRAEVESGWWSGWTVVCGGVDVTSQVPQPERFASDVSGWNVPTEYPTYVFGDVLYDETTGYGDGTVLLEWTSNAGSWTAVRHRVAAPVPTRTSELTNDSGFLTEHQDITGKADVSDVPLLAAKEAVKLASAWTYSDPDLGADEIYTEPVWANGVWTIHFARYSAILKTFVQVSGTWTVQGRSDAATLTFSVEGVDIIFTRKPANVMELAHLSDIPDISGKADRYPFAEVTVENSVVALQDAKVQMLEVLQSGAAFTVSPPSGTSATARDAVLVIDCTSLTEGQEPTVTWPAAFHPRTDAGTDLACAAGVRNVYYISEYAPGEFAVGGWQETAGGSA